MEQPSVTVFIPTFNRLARLKNALRSVLDQGDFVRLHVLDNASPDGTAEWLKNLQERDPRVQITLREHNVGASRNFLEGFETVETPYLVPLADDDELAPGFLQNALGCLKSDSSIAAAVFRTEIRRNGKAVAFDPPDAMTRRLDRKAHLTEWSEKGHYVSWSSVLWSTETIRKNVLAGEFERFGLPSDIWVQFLVFCEASVHTSNNVGSIFNVHEEQTSRGLGPHSVADFGEILSAMEAHLASRNTLDDEQKRIFLRNMGLHFNRVLGDHAKAMNREPTDDELRAWIECYLRHMYPHAGFAGFPFVTLFEEHKSLKGQLDAHLQRSRSLKLNAKTACRILTQRLISRCRALLLASHK